MSAYAVFLEKVFKYSKNNEYKEIKSVSMKELIKVSKDIKENRYLLHQKQFKKMKLMTENMK